MSNRKLTKAIARKVLEVVDAGLVSGVGNPVPGEMCVEAAVCYALGEKHGDNPSCVSPAVRSLKITLNDKTWSSDKARAKGLRRLAIAQLGTKGTLDDKKFAKRVAELAVRKMVPIALRVAASIQKDAKHRDALRKAANRCEVDGTQAAAYAATNAAYAATNAAYAAANAADAATYDAADAAYAAYAATNDAYAAANAATNAAYAAANAATNAAYAAAYTANATKKRDEVLSDFAEGVVQILIELKSPGTKWLDLTEAA